MVSSISATLAETLGSRRITRTTSLSVLLTLLSGYAAFLFIEDGSSSFLSESTGVRSLQVFEEKGEADSTSSIIKAHDPADNDARILPAEQTSRLLAKNGDSPPTSDEISGQYIVKPWVGNAMNDVWEARADTKASLHSAQASNVLNGDYLPKYAIDDPNLSTMWASSLDYPEDEEWINLDMGGPNTAEEVYIKWADAYAVDYKIYVAFERHNCRSDGGSCPDAWIGPVATVTGKSDASDDTHPVTAPQGIRYVRISMTKRSGSNINFNMYYARVYRKKRIIGETPISGVTCGDTTAAATSNLLSKHGGSLITRYDTAEFFLASMTEAQKDAMFADDCTFTVEPNYVVTARGSTRGAATKKKKRGLKDLFKREKSGFDDVMMEEDGHEQRNLAIPEFNMKDEDPPNWGLIRMSSHGKLNGKYIWFHEGTDVDLYMFDTAIYPDHSEWQSRQTDGTETPGPSRLAEATICAGTATDYTQTDHGTHLASVAAGYTMGTAKSATIYPIQVLDATEKGTTASILCGVDKLLADGLAWNLANAPYKHRAVVNLSLGAGGRSDALDKAVYDMTQAGYVVVIAAGNEDDNSCFYSPHAETAITIGALTYDEQGANSKTPLSNDGACVDFWAPGEDINGASNQGEFETVSRGETSVASAMVAGVATLFLEELATEDLELTEITDMVHERMVNKAEINIMVDYGMGSPNKIVQTTAVRCLQNSHCMTGLTCLRDGTCVDLTKPLKSYVT